MPLLALFVLLVGSLLYPESQLLRKRRQIFSRFAGMAALGFLLLIPLHIYWGLLLQIGTSDQVRALDSAERQLDSYRQAANRATSVADFQLRMAKLNAPPINPVVLARPLPEVKAQMDVAFNQIASQIDQQRKTLGAQSGWPTRAPEVLRIVIASLVLAFGFATFAQPTPTSPPLLDSLEKNLTRLRSKSLYSWKYPWKIGKTTQSAHPEDIDYMKSIRPKDSRDS
jgi:hypothetical protein